MLSECTISNAWEVVTAENRSQAQLWSNLPLALGAMKCRCMLGCRRFSSASSSAFAVAPPGCRIVNTCTTWPRSARTRCSVPPVFYFFMNNAICNETGGIDP
jgi:hypothetical protein